MQISNKDRFFLKTATELQVFFLASIFLLIFIFGLYLARTIVIPIVFAVLFDFLLSPSVRLLKRLYIPRSIGAALVLLMLLFILISCLYGLTRPATTWLQKGPTAISDVHQKLATLTESITTRFANVSKLGEEISFLSPHTQISDQSIANSKVSFVIGTAAVTWQFVEEFSITVILLYFLLIYDQYFLRQIVQMISSLERKKDVAEISHKIQEQIFKYLFARTIINVALAIVVSILMFILGMPDPILWGVMTGLLEFIPYIGALVSLVVITIVALFSFVSVAYAFLVVLLISVAVFIEANIISPIVFGTTLILNPIMIFLSLVFFTWLWGIAGAFIAVPMIVAIQIIVEALL